MGKYKPGTLDNFMVSERRRKKMSRTLSSANQPTGTQMFGTTKKVKDFCKDLSSLQTEIDDIKRKISEIEREVQSVEHPEGSVVFMACNVNPADLGMAGAWEFKATFQIPLTEIELFVYERISNDNDI